MWFAKQPANLDAEVKQSAQSLAWQLFCLSQALASSDSAQGHPERDDTRAQTERLLQQLREVGLQPAPGKVVRDLLLQANATAERLAERIIKLTRRRRRQLRGQNRERALVEMTAASVEFSRAQLKTQRKRLGKLPWPKRMLFATEGLVAPTPLPALPQIFTRGMGAPAGAPPMPRVMATPLTTATDGAAPLPAEPVLSRGVAEVSLPRQRI